MPTTWAASSPRGYTRRVSGISETPATFIADTVAARDAGTRCARYTKPVCALVSSLISVSWGIPSAGESSAASDTAFLTRNGSATMSSADSLIASSAPLRSVIAPRGPGTITLLTCCVAAARSSEPAFTEPRYVARASAIASSATNAMNRIPMRRSMSAKALVVSDRIRVGDHP